MESSKIEILLEKYFEGQTNSSEENELRNYFSSPNVVPHLEQYKPLFGYFAVAKKEEFKPNIQLQSKRLRVTWLSIAASVVVLLGIGTYVYFNTYTNQNQDLGTYTDPEIAFKETQKALALLSNQVNIGIESVRYVEEYQHSKNLIFKP
ncbi:hypothetical protein [Flavobacterium myungsuense]|uniref:Uncharacterized protein n=1 Tax=Flavobacterium myungsuense TaxID=651823 RepID=A0ABW3J195_9FLAO